METKDSTDAGNLGLWDRVQETDPNFTRGFQGSDGFNGTGVNPTYTFRKATSAFGPVGIGWGFDIVSEDYREGAPLGFDAAGNCWGRIVIHNLKLKLWYVLGEKRAEVFAYGATTFIGKGQNGGVFTDEDAPKKSLTDAIVKALSMAGFNADVFMGMYDDVKYVECLQARFQRKSADTPVSLGQRVPASVDRGSNPQDEARPTSAAPSGSAKDQAAKPAAASGDDPNAWIARINTFTEDNQFADASIKAPQYLKGEALKQVRAAIEQKQLETWLRRIPLVGRSKLASLAKQADTIFKGNDASLTKVREALTAREAAFANLGNTAAPQGAAVAA